MRKLPLYLLLLTLLCALGVAAANATSQSSQASIHQPTQAAPAAVLHRIVRINQLDPAQYNSPADYRMWAYSTCSTAAMAEIANFYGRHYRIADILPVQARLNEITPQLGLEEDVGIQRTMAAFGFTTLWGYRWTLKQLLQLANRGTPVIVGWPPTKYPGGHLVVIVGGSSTTVSIADSSRYNRHTLTYVQFLAWWVGFAAIITPAKGGQA